MASGDERREPDYTQEDIDAIKAMAEERLNRRRKHQAYADQAVSERMRQEDMKGYTAAHDAQHEQHEWVGLVAMHASAGEWIEAAALAIAAQQAEDAARRG